MVLKAARGPTALKHTENYAKVLTKLNEIVKKALELADELESLGLYELGQKILDVVGELKVADLLSALKSSASASSLSSSYSSSSSSEAPSSSATSATGSATGLEPDPAETDNGCAPAETDEEDEDNSSDKDNHAGECCFCEQNVETDMLADHYLSKHLNTLRGLTISFGNQRGSFTAEEFASEYSEKLGLTKESCEAILNALAGGEVLIKDGGVYGVNPVERLFFE